MPITAYLLILLSYHLIVNYIQDSRQTREANERAAALRFRLVVLKARRPEQKIWGLATFPKVACPLCAEDALSDFKILVLIPPSSLAN
jgi:hypothetical protein